MKKKYYIPLLAVTVATALFFLISRQKKDNNILNQYKHNLALAEKVKGLSYDEIQKIPKQDRPDLAALQEFEMTKDPELGYPPIDRTIEAYEKIKSNFDLMRTNQGKIKNVKWVERGPNNIAGRTRALMWDPNDPTNKKVWAGSVGGGLWFNKDITSDTSTWQVVNDFMANISIATINYDPSDTKIYYLGTGQGFTGRIRGAGIWKSTNGGASWDRLSSTTNGDFNYVQKIMVTDKGIVFAATNSGLFISKDKGNSWVKTHSGRISDIEFGADGTVYMSKGHRSWRGDIFSSSDNGNTWKKITPPSSSSYRRIELATAPSNANVLYAVAQSTIRRSTSDIAWFKKSTDQGNTWIDIEIPKYVNSSTCEETNSHFTRGQAWFDLIMGVHPKDEKRVIVGGIDLHLTSNGGEKWNGVSYWTGNNNCDDYVHADQHAIVFRPNHPNEAIFGNDGGVFYSKNLNEKSNNPEFHPRNNGYNVTTFYAVAASNQPNSNTFLAGAQDNGTQLFRSPGINYTTEATGGDGGYCFINQNDPMTMISSYVYNNYRVSINGGKSFRRIRGVSGGHFINPTEYDSDADVLYGASSANYISRMRDVSGVFSTLHIVKLSIDGGIITALKASPHTDNVLFIGVRISSDNTKIYKIINAQSSVPIVSDITGIYSGRRGGWVSSIDVGASDDQLLATFSNYGVNSVYETMDGGKNWSSKEGNLPDIPIRWGIYNPNNRSEVLLATELGVWSTDDLSKSSPVWEPTNTGLANVRVTMIKYRTSDGLVAISTFGRGIYTSDVFLPKSLIRAEFNTKQTIAYVDVPVVFRDYSLNPNNSWEWKFGDGGTSKTQNPSHTYKSPGVYTVSLTVNNGKKFEVKNDYITVLPKKKAPYTLADGGNFESNTNDFVGKPLFNGLNHWEHGVPGNELNKVSSGTKAWKTRLNRDIGKPFYNYKSALYTPAFDLSDNTKEYTIKFKKWMENGLCRSPHAMQLQYSTDGGISWHRLGGSQPEYGAVNWYNMASDLECSLDGDVFDDKMGWVGTNTVGLTTGGTNNTVRNQNTEYKLNFLAGQPHVSFRFVSSVANSVYRSRFERDGFMIDDFQIVASKIPAEFEVNKVFSYTDNKIQFSFLSNAKGVKKFAWNFGDGSPVSQVANPKHSYSKSGTFTVTLTITLASGEQVIKKKESIITILPNKKPPYTLKQGGNFETNISDFIAHNVNGTPFERGKSAVPGKDGTASGKFAWVTGLKEKKYKYNSEAYLYTPNYNISNLRKLVLKFKSKFELEPKWDGFIVEYSTDKGKFWKNLNDEVKEGWYNVKSSPNSAFGQVVPIFSGSTNGIFKKFKTIINFKSSQKNIAFRFKFLSDDGDNEAGIAIDDFELEIPPYPNFKASRKSVCKGEKVTFTDLSTGEFSDYLWDFGTGASPATAKGKGPHQVTYSKVGKSTVKLTVKDKLNQTQIFKRDDFITTVALHKPSILRKKINETTVKLTASSGDSYQWYLNNKKINGANKKSIEVSKSGNYSVDVNISGCTVRASWKYVITSFVTIDSKKLSIYPNPSSDGLFNLKSNSQAKDVTIYNSLGKVVLYRQFTNSHHVLDLSDQPNGLYVVVISANSEIVKKKIHIMK